MEKLQINVDLINEIIRLRSILQECVNRVHEDPNITVPINFVMLMMSGLEK